MKFKILTPFIFCLLFFPKVHAATTDSCRAIYQPTIHALQTIETELHAVNGQKMYEESVIRRYNTLEQLLKRASQCDSSLLPLEEQRNIHQIRMTLASLQASAQASAFTKFSDWLKAKDLDLALCQKLTQAIPSNKH